MTNEEQFKALVAKNLTNYRKINNLTQLDSITPLNFAIAIGAISLILNIIIAAILVISSVPIFNALVDVLIGFVCAFIAAMLIALSYNFLAPKLGKLKVELE